LLKNLRVGKSGQFGVIGLVIAAERIGIETLEEFHVERTHGEREGRSQKEMAERCV
jgi:hypothetical protein